MASKKNKASAALSDAVERDAKVQNVHVRSGDQDVNIELDEFLGLPEQDEPTQTYPNPGAVANKAAETITPAPAAQQLQIATPPIMARRGVWDPFAAAREPMLLESRAAAMRSYNALSEDVRPQYTIRVNKTTGTWYLARKPLALSNDPYVKEMGARIAEADAKVSALEGDLTERQRTVLAKLRNRAINYVKGPKKSNPRPSVSAKALDRLVFRALEFQASRRKAQLGVQERAARKQRHDLVGKKRTIGLPNGQRVGYNMRAAKKAASDAIIGDNMGPLKEAAKAERAARTALNKQRRVSYAQARNNKINAKDLPPGSGIVRQPFRGDIPEGFITGRGVTQLPVV